MPCRSKACMASWEEGRRGCGYGDHHRRGLSQESQLAIIPKSRERGEAEPGKGERRSGEPWERFIGNLGYPLGTIMQTTPVQSA
jgi:hypothetical protein